MDHGCYPSPGFRPRRPGAGLTRLKFRFAAINPAARRRGAFFRRRFFAAVLAACIAPALSGEPVKAELLWTGSWEQDASLINRGDIRLRGFGLSARAQAVDKRPAWENMDEGNTAFSGGLYHGATGSRVLYCILDEWGLPARLRNPWARAVPFAENRRPTISDLKTEASSTKEPAGYLYLGSPRIGPLRAFTSILLGKELNPAYSGGAEIQFGKKRILLFEGFYTDRKLASQDPASWFSSSPPLPERKFRFYGANISFTAPRLGVAVDGAYSETFALGRGLYGNFGLRLGDKPWRLSLAADSAGSAYVDREGNAAGAGFRTAVRAERRGTRNSLFRLGAALRAPALGEPFERNSGAVYYRLPASGKHPIRLSRFSLYISRDASEPEKPLDSVEGSLGLDLGPVRSTFQAALTGLAGAAGVSLPNPGGVTILRISRFPGDWRIISKPCNCGEDGVLRGGKKASPLERLRFRFHPGKTGPP